MGFFFLSSFLQVSVLLCTKTSGKHYILNKTSIINDSTKRLKGIAKQTHFLNHLWLPPKLLISCLIAFSIFLWERLEAFLNCYTAQRREAEQTCGLQKENRMWPSLSHWFQQKHLQRNKLQKSVWNCECKAVFRLMATENRGSAVIMANINQTACFSVRALRSLSAWMCRKISKSLSYWAQERRFVIFVQ